MVVKVKEKEALDTNTLKKINDNMERMFSGKHVDLNQISKEQYKELAKQYPNMAALYSLYDPKNYDPKVLLANGKLSPEVKKFLEEASKKV
ncbi:MAG: hypothetical protein QXW80_04075 [Candidatus Micrarchaeia archaeon]